MKKARAVLAAVFGTLLALTIQYAVFIIPYMFIDYVIIAVEPILSFLTSYPMIIYWLMECLINALLYGFSAFTTDKFLSFFFRRRDPTGEKVARIIVLICIAISAVEQITLPSDSLTIEGLLLAASVFIPSHFFLKRKT